MNYVYYYAHFIDMETESQIVKSTYTKSQCV